MSTNKILTRGGFDKIPLELPEQGSQKVRLYHLGDQTPEKVAKAKEALKKKLEQQYNYKGQIEEFENEIKEKPYLLKEGKTLQLIDGKADKTSNTPQTTSSFSSYLFSYLQKYLFKQTTVSIGGNFNVTGEHASIHLHIQQMLSKSAFSNKVSKETISDVKKSLKEFYQDRDSYIKCSFISDEEPALPIESFIDVSIVQEKVQADAEQEILDEPNQEKREQIYEIENKETIPLENILKLKKDDQPLRLLILGRPGIGKSTLLQRCGWQWWSLQGIWKENYDLVFSIDLGKLPTSESGQQKSLEELLFNLFFEDRNDSPVNSSQEVKDLLKAVPQQRILFLLNGYDEFPANSLYRKTIDQRLLNKKESYNIILTSRFSKKPPNANFDTILECIGLTSEKIYTYLKTFKSQKAKEIWNYIHTSPVLRSLAHVPLLLEMISKTWEKLSEKSKLIPLTRTELYATIREQLYEAFVDKQRMCFPSIPEEKIEEKKDQAEKFTAELAFRAMERGNTLFEHALLKSTQDHCKFSDMDSLLKPGFIHGRHTNQQYYFPHLTLQEHWAATHLVEALLKKQPVILHKDSKPKWVTVKEFIELNRYNPRYIVVWEFVAGILGKHGKDSDTHQGDIKPLMNFLNEMLANSRDLLGLYETRFVGFLNEASIQQEEAEVVNQLLAIYDTYFKANLNDTLRLRLSKSHPVWQMLTLGCPINTLEKLVSQLDDYRVPQIFESIIQAGRILPSKLIFDLWKSLIQTDSQTQSNRAADVLDLLAETAQFFPKQIKDHLKTILSGCDDELLTKTIPILGKLVKSGRMASEEVVTPLLNLLGNSSKKVKKSVIRAFRDIAQCEQLPSLNPEIIKKLLAHNGIEALLSIAKTTKQDFPLDVLKSLVSEAIVHNGQGPVADLLETIVQTKKSMPNELIEKIIGSKAGELLKKLVEAGLALSNPQVEHIFNTVINDSNTYSVRSSLKENSNVHSLHSSLEKIVKSGHRLSAKSIQTLINKILLKQTNPHHTQSLLFLLRSLLRAGQSIEDKEIDRLSQILKEAKNEFEQGNAASILETVAKARKLTKNTVSILKNTLCDKTFPIVLQPVLLALTLQAEEITADDLPGIIKLMGIRFTDHLGSPVFDLLQALINKGLPFPLDAIENSQKILLQDNAISLHAPAVNLLKKLSGIPAYASSAEKALHMAIKELSIRALQENFEICLKAFSTMKVIAEIEPTFPLETIEALECLLHKDKLICAQTVELFDLLAKSRAGLPQTTIVALGKMLSKEDTISYFAASALASLTANDQKLPDEILQDLIRLILLSKPGSVWSKTCTPSKPALLAIRNMTHALPGWVEVNVIKNLVDRDESKSSNVLKILEEIIWNRKTLSPQIIKKLLSVAAEGKRDRHGHLLPAAAILSRFDLSKELEFIKSNNFPRGILADMLAKTPIKAIVEAKVFTPIETGWFLARRLIERHAALFLYNEKLSFFENGKRHEISLNPKDVEELLPHIHTAASSQIGIMSLA